MNTTKYLALALITAVAFTSCKDKDDDATPSKPQAEVESLEVGSVNTFRNINVSDNTDWTVAKTPSWATPMAYTGLAGEQLKLFVQSNNNDADRTDTLFVNLADGKAKQYVITQYGQTRDSENGRALSDDDLLYTCGVGFCIDVFDDNSSSMSKYGIHNSSPFDYGLMVAELKRTSQDETFAEELRYISRTENITGNSQKAISDQLSANGNITVGINAFEATIKGSYSRNSTSTNKYVYALQEVQHIVKSRYIDGTLMRYWAENNANVFQGDFIQLVTRLKDDPTNTRNLNRLVTQFGTHIVTYAGLGGELMISMEMQVDTAVNETDINGALHMGYKSIALDGNAKYTDKEKNIANNTKLKLRTIGGENAYILPIGSTFDEFQKILREAKKMDEWIGGLKDYSKLQVIDIQTIPIWEVMPTTELREALRTYIMGDYQKSRLKSAGIDYNSGLYRITGFNTTSATAKRDSLAISAIGQAVICDRKVVEGINGGKMATFIYSGPFGSVNKTCAFFVGDTGFKPCKVYFDEKGKVKATKTIEPLEAKTIPAIYIDGTGDITISPKGDLSLYNDVSF